MPLSTLCTLTLGALHLTSPPPSPQGAVPVRLESNEPVLVGVHPVPSTRLGEPLRQTPFSPLCTTPCVATLAPGDHELAVLRPKEAPLVAAPSLRVSGPGHLGVEVVSRETERKIGFWITAITVPAGAALTTIGFIPSCDNDSSCARRASFGIWGGIGLISFGGLFGVPLWFRKDEVVVRFAPAPNGVSVTGRY